MSLLSCPSFSDRLFPPAQQVRSGPLEKVSPFRMASYLTFFAAKCVRLLVKFALVLEGSQKEQAIPGATLHLESSRSEDSGADKGKAKEAPPVLVHVYLPKKEDDGEEGADTLRLPVVVNLHGSGFVLDTFGEDGHFCQKVANEVQCVVMDVAYSKAPERPFPAASEDVDSVLTWISDKTGQLEERLAEMKENVKLDSDRVALTGFSSGGNLALTACVRAKQASRLGKIKAVVAFYPSTNLAESPYEKPQLKPAEDQAGAVLPPYLRKFLYHCYVPLKQEVPRSAPIISPINANEDDFPHSVTVITCEGDSLAREAQQMVEKMQKERSVDGKEDMRESVRGETAINGFFWWEAKGQGHNWDKMSKDGTDAAQMRDFAYDLAVERIKTSLYQS